VQHHELVPVAVVAPRRTLTLTFSSKRWNAPRAVDRDRDSLRDWDLAHDPDPATVATESADRLQLFLLQARRVCSAPCHNSSIPSGPDAACTRAAA
jgi:hypothetical protein